MSKGKFMTFLWTFLFIIYFSIYPIANKRVLFFFCFFFNHRFFFNHLSTNNFVLVSVFLHFLKSLFTLILRSPSGVCSNRASLMVSGGFPRFQVMTGFGAPNTRHLRVTSWSWAAFTVEAGASTKLGGSAVSHDEIIFNVLKVSYIQFSNRV